MRADIRGFRPSRQTQVFFRTLTHSLPRQKTRDAGTVMPPLEGRPAIVSPKHTPHTFHSATVDMGHALCLNAGSLRRAWPQAAWYNQWQASLLHHHLHSWPM